jgi:hypothetical protein
VQPTTALLPGGQTSFNEAAAFEEIEHNNRYLPDSGVGPRCA